MIIRNTIVCLFFVLLACAFPVSAQQQQQRTLQQQRNMRSSEQSRAAQQRAIRDQNTRRQLSERQMMARKLQQQKTLDQNNRLTKQRRSTNQRLVQQRKLQKNRQEQERKNRDIGTLALIGSTPKTSINPQLSQRIRNLTQKSANNNNRTKVFANIKQKSAGLGVSKNNKFRNTGKNNRPPGVKSGSGGSGRPPFQLTKVSNKNSKPLPNNVALRVKSVTNGPKNGPIYVTPKGVAVTSETLAKQGTSHLAGNFKGLSGSSVDDIISRVPKNWKMVPQDRGRGIKFLDAQGFERIRLHGPSTRAPGGSNSASGWTMRIMDRAGNYYDNAGNVVPYKANAGHIPIRGNPNAP